MDLVLIIMHGLMSTFCIREGGGSIIPIFLCVTDILLDITIFFQIDRES